MAFQSRTTSALAIAGLHNIATAMTTAVRIRRAFLNNPLLLIRDLSDHLLDREQVTQDSDRPMRESQGIPRDRAGFSPNQSKSTLRNQRSAALQGCPGGRWQA